MRFSFFFVAISSLHLLPCSGWTGSMEPSVQACLKNPSFSEGVLSTKEGGTLTSEGIRIQAQDISYISTTKDGDKVMRIRAEGDILFSYEGHFFTGTLLEYDFLTKTGYLLHGRTAQGIWFVGGDRIYLNEDKSFTIENAFVTTSESQENTWSLRAKKVDLSGTGVVSAQKVHLHLEQVPVLWLPYFSCNLGFVSDPPIQYKVTWDKGLGPRATMRYRAFSTQDFNLYTRLDYGWKDRFGAAIETQYSAQDTLFVTRSYGAHDKIVFDEHGLKRYRLQGIFSHESQDRKTKVHLTYDKFSDLKMISDFSSPDFEIDTQKRNRLLVHHHEDIGFTSINVSPRLNRFESLNQKLPLIKTGILPLTLGNSGIIMDNFVSAGYLDYVYASELISTYPTLRETHAARIQTQNRIYRPFRLGPIQCTPTVGVMALFYNNNPHHEAVGQGVITYGGYVGSKLYRRYGSIRHGLEPYASYTGLSHPKSRLSNHYTFGIDDGVYQINSLRLGIRNTLSYANSGAFAPNLTLDLYTRGFFPHTTFTKTFPKQYATLTWSAPSYLVEATTCLNTQESVWDFANILTKVTVSEDVAFILEFRHRSRYDWRKANHENFLVDMARPIQELAHSPLSDPRNTFLGKLQIRLSPKWNCQFSSHYGWARPSEPRYHSFKIDALTLITAKCLLKISYLHTTNDDRVSFGLQIAK